jgi:hypothetical protein
MDCPQCQTPLPPVSHFCHRCGADQQHPGEARRAFAVKPDEPVASLALVSTIMPRGAGERPQTYRTALVVALLLALLAACFGALPIAVVLAAFAIPVVYIVYLYDVNLWDDHPVVVTGLAFALTLGLGVGFTALWWGALSPSGPPIAGLGGEALAGPGVSGLLVVALLVPVVGELLRQIGPVVLASRPRYDDLLDGASFGVISGVAFATADTLVRHWPLITGGLVREVDPGLWMSLIFLEGFVKPLVIGTATGIACAEFSGLGKGYDGFTGRYLRGLGIAVLANVGYFGGTYLIGLATDGTFSVVLSVLWGMAVLAVLVIKMRRVLHLALMEAALDAAHAEAAETEDADADVCAQCEMPMLPSSRFCSACGASVRSRHKDHHLPGASAATAAVAATPAPDTGPPGDAPSPSSQRSGEDA